MIILIEYFCSICCFVLCWVYIFEYCIIVVSGVCCIIIVRYINVFRTFGLRFIRVEEIFIVVVIWIYLCIIFIVFVRIVEFVGSFGGLVSDIVVCFWIVGILEGKFCVIWIKMFSGIRFWGDCGFIVVFIWKKS